MVFRHNLTFNPIRVTELQKLVSDRSLSVDDKGRNPLCELVGNQAIALANPGFQLVANKFPIPTSLPSGYGLNAAPWLLHNAVVCHVTYANDGRPCTVYTYCNQWLTYSKVGGKTLHFLLSLSLPSPLFPSLRSIGPSNPARIAAATGSGLWGRAIAVIRFGAFNLKIC